jgi:hypothetical protein
MKERFEVPLLAACAAGISLAGIAAGSLAAFLAAPVALLIAIQAAVISRGVTPYVARRLVGAGLAALALAVLCLGSGAILAAATCVLAGVGVLRCATQLALRFDPPPEGLERPRPGAGLVAGVVLDEGVKLLWETRSRTGPRSDFERLAADVRTAADRNHEEGWLGHPERSHLAPPPLEKAHRVERRVRGSGRALEVGFASEYEPLDSEIRDSYLAVRSNRTASALLFQRDRGEPRPTLICVHGYGLSQPALLARIWDVAWFDETLGIDLALFELPLHGGRSVGRRSGEGFLDGHPLWTSAAMGQAVWDLRKLSGWLRDQGAPAVGVSGQGLGGYVAAVFSSVGDSLACSVPMLPVASLESFVWRQLSPRLRVDARAAGLSESLLADAWARHAPLKMRPRVAHEARMVVGALADRIAPPAEASTLWEHWGRPTVHWMPGTHLWWSGRAAMREALAAHLRETLGADHESPSGV